MCIYFASLVLIVWLSGFEMWKSYYYAHFMNLPIRKCLLNWNEWADDWQKERNADSFECIQVIENVCKLYDCIESTYSLGIHNFMSFYIECNWIKCKWKLVKSLRAMAAGRVVQCAEGNPGGVVKWCVSSRPYAKTFGPICVVIVHVCINMIAFT